MKMRQITLALMAATMLAMPVASAVANEGGEYEIPKLQWSFQGPFGTYDKAALQRGYKIYREVCSSCHSMKRIAFRNLHALGYNEEEIKAIAGSYTVTDGPNDEGEMFDRPARPSDHFKSPFANDKAAAYANGGALPPDLSLITKARHGGADYIHALLTGYGNAPAEAHIPEGKHWNAAFPGNVISMAAPLSDGQIAYEDNTPQTVDQYARDVAQFLTWTAEPELEARKRMGAKVILFLIVFAGIMYSVKKKIWAKMH